MDAFLLGVILAFLPPAAPNVHVYSCQVMSGLLLPQHDEIGLAVRFENMSSDPLKSIVWRAKYGSTWIDFTDDGNFSPQTRIDNYVLFEAGKRKFNYGGALSNLVAIAVGAYPASPEWNAPAMFEDYAGYNDPGNCTIARAISADGSLWVNDELADEEPFVFPSPAPSPSATPAPNPVGNIDVAQCEPMIGGNGELGIRFTNVAAHTAKRIVFRIPYKNSGLDFVDEGTFSSGVLIKHVLHIRLPDALRQVAYVPFASRDLCHVVSVDYDDGTIWRNLTLGAAPPPLPTPVPDAISEREIVGIHWNQLHGFPTPLPSASPASAPTSTP